MIDLTTGVDSVADGVISAGGALPNVAENVAKEASSYAAAISRDLDELKADMPDHPEAVPRVALGVVGQTVGAGLGLIGAVVAGVDKAIKDIKTQTERVTK